MQSPKPHKSVTSFLKKMEGAAGPASIKVANGESCAGSFGEDTQPISRDVVEHETNSYMGILDARREVVYMLECRPEIQLHGNEGNQTV